jgi:aldose 1-epimerase
MPRYQLEQRPSEGGTGYHLIDSERRAEAVLYPALGNNCVAFRTTPDPDGKDARGAACAPVDVFVPPDRLEDLRTINPILGGQPILFPFPNRVRAGTFTFEGRTYKMEGLLAKGWDKSGGQAIHGLVADKPWNVDAAFADDSGATVRAGLQLDAYPDIFEQYPFPCRLTITYRLHDGILDMHTEVANQGEHTQPMGFGIHPWFPTRLRPGVRLTGTPKDITPAQRGRAQVHVPAAALWKLEKLMPTGKVIPVEDLPGYDLRAFTPLNNHSLDHVFTRVVHQADGWSEGGLRDPESGLEMYLAADAAFREWVLYAPEDRTVIALEPYTCTTDAVNLQPQGIDAGLIALSAGQTWASDIRFGLRRSD